jgi:CRP/FNR family cyclic AMP-dependent transcriptional regulator
VPVVQQSETLEPGLQAFVDLACSVELKQKETMPVDHAEGGIIYLVLKGTASLMLTHEDDKMVILNHLRAGDIFGEAGLFNTSRITNNTLQLKARTNCELAGIPHDQFEAFAATQPNMLISICRRLNARLNATTHKLACIAFHDVENRVLAELKELCRHEDAITHPDGMQVKLTRKELAMMVPCTREMAGRALKSLEKLGQIQVSGQTLVVHGTR